MLKANHLPFYFPPSCLAIFLLLSKKDTLDHKRESDISPFFPVSVCAQKSAGLVSAYSLLLRKTALLVPAGDLLHLSQRSCLPCLRKLLALPPPSSEIVSSSNSSRQIRVWSFPCMEVGRFFLLSSTFSTPSRVLMQRT